MIFQTFNNDIDKSIAKIGLFNKSIWAMKQDFKHGNGLAFSILGGQSVTAKDRQAILDFNTQLQNGVKPAKAWATTMANCSIAAQNQTRQCLKAKGSLTELANGLETMTVGAKAGQVALRGLSIAGNMLAMWGISVAIQTAAKWIDKFVHSAEYAEKAIKAATDSAKSFSGSIKDIQKETVDMEKSIDSIIDRYAKLSQGVNTFTNENISLPTDQYEEFLGLNKQLTEIFPSLTRNYDENGNAILGLSGSVDSVTESIRSLVEQEKELARAQIRENLEKYFEGTDEADGAWKALEGRKQKLEEANEALTTLKNTYEGLINADTSTVVGQYHKNFAGKEQAKYIEYIKNNFGEDIAKAMEDAVSIHLGKGLNGQFADLVVDFSKLELTEAQKEQIARSYDTFYSELLAKQKTAMSEFESQNFEFSNNAMLWLEDLSFYKDSDKYTQTAIQNLVRNIDWSNYDFKELDYEGVKRILQDSVLTPFQIACDDPNTKKSLDNALKGLFTIDTSDMSVGDITTQIDSYINTIATAIGEDSSKLKLKFGFNDTDTLPLINNVKEKLQDEFVDRIGELKIDELKIAAGLEIPNATLLSWDELIAKIKEAQNSTVNENPISTFEDAWADSFTSENDKVKELGDTLLDLAEKGRLTKEAFKEADSTAGDYFKNLGISADEAVSKVNKLVDESKQLSSMSDQISSMAEALGTKLEDGFVSADTLSGFDVEVRGLESWDRFQSVLGSTTSSYEECQEAANALATEWINSSDFLAQLTEQNEEYYRTQLKAMGIENYDEVISYAHSLNEAKEVLSQSSLELGNATYDEIEALIEEGTYSELTANMILALYDAKIAEQAVTLDTAADCENLIALAGDTDRTSQSIQLLIQLMNIYNQLESGAYENNAVVRGGALAAAVAIKSQLETIANSEVKNMEIEPTVKLGSKGKSDAKKSGKKTADAYLEAFEKELEKLQGMRDRNEITEKEYLDRLRVA